MKKYSSFAPILFAMATIAFGLLELITGDFNKGLLPVPAFIPGRSILAYCSGVILVVLGTCVLVKKWRTTACISLGVVYLIFFVFLHLIKLSADIYDGGEWTATFEVLLLSCGAFLISGKFSQITRYALSICFIVFAILHFKYGQYIATLIPAWVPGKLFLAYFIGVGFLVTAISIMINVMTQISTMIIGIMFLIWVIILHIPRAAAAVNSEPEWTSLFVALAAAATSFMANGLSGSNRRHQIRTSSLLFIALFSSIFCVAQSGNTGLKIAHVTGDVYVYTTYKSSGSVTVPSNSMYVVTNNQVVLFDTPWDAAQFQPLLDSIEARHHKPVNFCIVTHYHPDRTAGLGYFKAIGIATWSSALTYQLSVQHNVNQAENYFYHDTVFTIDNYSFETYYPGPGHTEDNIVIWLPADKVLYAGCLVKSMDYKILGYTPDADMMAWPESVRKVILKYPGAQYVIPGHFNWGDKNSLEHTIKLVKQKRKEKG
ncbi:MAG: subclass B1 metallo-beta-lactamase, partial [Bacteroidota bacterium]